MSKQDVIIGNCLDILKGMQSESIDCVVTSPPYWNLRDYKSEPARYGVWEGQLGLEDTPDLYISHLLMIFDEIKRVLKPTGACWVNIGDTYMSKDICGIRQKSLCLIPSRFAIAMTDRGWILRNENNWYKSNVMPSPIKDRFTVDFEKFFFFTKSPKYYFKQQFEPLKEESIARAKRAKNNTLEFHDRIVGTNSVHMKHNDPNWKRFAPDNGRNCRTTWEIPLKGEHYNHIAMFPKALIERPIDACCPPGGVVLDPFCGSGTVLEYCFEHDIEAIGIEINPIYEPIIKKRANYGQKKLLL